MVPRAPRLPSSASCPALLLDEGQRGVWCPFALHCFLCWAFGAFDNWIWIVSWNTLGETWTLTALTMPFPSGIYADDSKIKSLNCPVCAFWSHSWSKSPTVTFLYVVCHMFRTNRSVLASCLHDFQKCGDFGLYLLLYLHSQIPALQSSTTRPESLVWSTPVCPPHSEQWRGVHWRGWLLIGGLSGIHWRWGLFLSQNSVAPTGWSVLWLQRPHFNVESHWFSRSSHFHV